MHNASRLRSAVTLAASLTAVLTFSSPVLAQIAEGPGPEELATFQVAAVIAPDATLAASPSAGLPREVLEAAGAYRLYMRNAAAVSADFADGASIAGALKLGAAYEPKQLTRGAVAFAAVAALHEPAFVNAVRTVGADPARRATLIAELTASPHLVAGLRGADAAAGRAAAALSGEGERVHAAGVRVKQAAYDVQRQAWAKGEVSARVERLANVKALSAQLLNAPSTEVAELQLASLGAGRLELPAGSPEATQRPVVSRGLVLAALAVLGEADAVRAQPLMDDANCGSCLRMSKLNLFQCLAVAKPWYEDVFCLGQHVLMDTGDCIQAAALPKRPAALPAVHHAGTGTPYSRTPYQPQEPAKLTTVAALR